MLIPGFYLHKVSNDKLLFSLFIIHSFFYLLKIPLSIMWGQLIMEFRWARLPIILL